MQDESGSKLRTNFKKRSKFTIKSETKTINCTKTAAVGKTNKNLFNTRV